MRQYPAIGRATPQKTGSMSVRWLSPALTSAADCLPQSFKFRFIKVNVGKPKECRDSLLGGAGEIGFHDVLE
ncbi:MAG TPA: hypothetical protein VII02_11870, partial [Gemmatimonadaceae bacterium]